MRTAEPDTIRTSLACASAHHAGFEVAKLLIRFGLDRQVQAASWA